MPEDIRVWEITDGDSLQEIGRGKLDLEKRLEDWLARDISIISDDLLVIGRQVNTDFGGAIDLLCLDHNGDVVIIELKRDRTPRETTAQALDYGAWVNDLSNERITDIADRYLGNGGPLEDAFEKRFGAELPEILNENHKMLIVASEIDSSSERIIKYLSDTYGIGINVTTFHYYRDSSGRELLTRTFLMEPSDVDYKGQIRPGRKRKPPFTYEQLEEIAERAGVGGMYRELVEEMTGCFDQRGTTLTTVAFIGNMEGRRNTILSFVPGESDESQGLRFQVYIDRLCEYLGVSKEEVVRILPSNAEQYQPWRGAPPTMGGFFKNRDEVGQFLTGLKELKQRY